MNKKNSTDLCDLFKKHGFDASLFGIGNEKYKVLVKKSGKEVYVDMEPFKSPNNPLVNITNIKEEAIRSLRMMDLFEPNNQEKSIDKYLFGILS